MVMNYGVYRQQAESTNYLEFVWSHRPDGASMQQLVLGHLFKFSGISILL